VFLLKLYGWNNALLCTTARKWWPRMLWGSDHPAVRLQGAYHRFRSSYNCPMVEFQFENHSVNPLGPKSCICCCHSFHFKGYITQHLTEVFQIYGFPSNTN
jgi:hypothetical protein